MSRPRERDEQEALKLDEYFKETLARVRPYILALTSTEDVQLCRLWLDKLSYASSQRTLRNQYLVELCRQLKSGHVGGVFSAGPPNGCLAPLPRPYHVVNISSSLSELSDASTSPCQDWPRSSTKIAQRHFPRSKTPSRRREADTVNANHCVHGGKPSIKNARYLEETCADRNQMKAYKQRIETLTTIVKELQIQNERLNQELVQCQEKCPIKETPHLHANVKQLTAEITMLKAKLMEVQKMKELLEQNHKEIVQQYKTAMTEQFMQLKIRLEEAQCKNTALDNNVVAITQKLEQITRGKESEVNAIEKEWTQKWETTQQHYEKLIEQKEGELQAKDELISQKELELTQKDLSRQQETETLNKKILELENKLEAKIEDESKLQEMVSEKCATMKEEFHKMRNDMEMAMQKQSQSFVNKIAALKKAVSKLEKSKEKLKQECERRIAHILKDKELEIKTLQLQLQGQRSELSMSLSSEKQCELDSLVENLEERYKALLASVDASADNQRQNYLRKITTLEGQLIRLKKTLVRSETRVCDLV